MMKSKIKILYVLDHFDTPSGGTEGQFYNLIKKLDKNIFEPELCLYRYINNYFDENEFPVSVLNMNIKSFRNLSTYFKLISLRNYIRKNNHDIVQIIFNDTALSVPLIAAGLKAKVIATRRDMGFWYTPIKLKILRQFVPLTDAYLVNSHTVKHNVIEKEKAPEQKIKVIYNAHRMDRFKAQAKFDFSSQNDIPAGSQIVGIVSNFRPVKRVGDLIRAFSTVLNTIKNTFLVIIGDPGTYQQGIMDLVRELGIEDHVRLLGMIDIDHIISYIKWFNVGVICSESEGLSNAIIEYMGCGVPVIATDIPSNRELIDNEESGILYPVGDIDALSRELIRVLDDNHLESRLSIHSKDQIRTRFDEETIIQQYQDFYIKLVSNYFNEITH
jgi:L-malate glycosyltransferase